MSRPLKGFGSLLELTDATRETDELLLQFTILYPDERVLRSALRATAAYQPSWSDESHQKDRRDQAADSTSEPSHFKGTFDLG